MLVDTGLLESDGCRRTHGISKVVRLSSGVER